jgi:hypothetical protein
MAQTSDFVEHFEVETNPRHFIETEAAVTDPTVPHYPED